MKDIDGTELVKGDTCILVLDKPVENPSQVIIFLKSEEYVYKVAKDGAERTKTTDTIKYYPLTDDGLEVANYDAGVSNTALHREQKFVATHIKPKNLIKINPNHLIGYKKTIYNEISNLLNV